ncbi:hypothetical protein A0H81_06192 [Grifola frondosa]|uniref:DUF6534 domain-containing protein n=1 Tax=Grifola frondosa TaxID=5627 RepID=A0A1C7MA95_GRIFR|nr:hypothetical protein A0H81_06192 [Grifola frondosa]
MTTPRCVSIAIGGKFQSETTRIATPAIVLCSSSGCQVVLRGTMHVLAITVFLAQSLGGSMAGPNLGLDSSVGCIFIGTLFANILYAGTCAQTVFYYRRYRNDRWPLKGLVFLLWLLDTVTTILDIEVVWQFTVRNHANPFALLQVPKTFVVEFAVNSFTIYLVQGYFINKIWKLLENRWYKYPLTLAGLALALVSLGGGFGTSYELSVNNTDATAIPSVKTPASIQQVTSIVCDIYITVSLCVILWKEKTGFKRTDSLLDKLAVYALQRGFVTATIQLCHFAIYIGTINKLDLIWMVFHIPGNKGEPSAYSLVSCSTKILIAILVYVNSLLAVLNVRKHLRDTSYESGATDFELVGFRSSHAPAPRPSRTLDSQMAKTTYPVIMLTREVIRIPDE